MKFLNNFMQQLTLDHPIIQAPMAGGGDTPELVATVCSTGALGFLGAAYLTPSQIIDASRAVRARTSRPFGINLFAPLPEPPIPDNLQMAMEQVAPFYEVLGLPFPEVPRIQGPSFDQQLSAIIESGASVFSFTFGTLSPQSVEIIKKHGLFLVGTATTVEEAVVLQDTGVDAVVAQGSEAGGHRGTFLGDVEKSMVGTIALVPQIVDAVSVPVIASGGIMDGRGIAAALALGASAVQMGTAFLTCDEAGVSEAYKVKILTALEQDTRLTEAFSGRFARGIVNEFMTAIDCASATKAILPFPLQNTLTRPIRQAAAKRGRTEYLSLWAGQGTRMSRRQSAKALIEKLVRETDATLHHLKSGVR
jgi:nitronate monooxygenase